MKVVHQLPGRIRLRLSEGECGNYSAGEIESIARQISGIYSANYTKTTRSLVLYHATEQNSAALVRQVTKVFEKERFFVQASTNLFSAFIFERFAKTQLSPIQQSLFLAGSFLETLNLNPSVFQSGTRQLIKKKPNADSLTMISVLAAYLIKQPLTATTVMIMSSLADYIGKLTDEQSRASLHQSLRQQHQVVHQVVNGQIRSTPLNQIQVGDTLQVYTGEKILVDGIVSAGHGRVNEATITGEFQPVTKHQGVLVYAGTVVESGQLELVAKKLGSQTEEAAIYQLLEAAENNKSELQKIADRLAQKMVLVSFGAALFTFILKRNLAQAIGVLVVDFVCGVKLSSETAILTTMNRFTDQGVVIKGGRSIENAAQVKEVVFDKTGTLTTGKPTIQKICTAPKVAKEHVLSAAAYAEQHSHHPLSRVILQAVEKPVPTLALTDEKTLVGYGVQAKNYHGQTVLVGSDKLMAIKRINFESIPVPKHSHNQIYVALNDQPLGIIVIDDAIRSQMIPTVQGLKTQGISELTMLTGDKSEVANQVAEQVGLTKVKSRLLPQDKVAYIKQARQTHGVMMIGDGLNDSAALKWSDVGVALGQNASDAAKEACDVLIQEDQPEVISEIVGAAQQTMKVIEQNYRIVFAVNTTVILLSVAGKIHPIVGSILHNGTTIGVILRSLFVLKGGNEHERKDGRAP